MVGNCRIPSDSAVLNSGHGNILKVADTGLTTSVSDVLPVPRQPAPFTKPQWLAVDFVTIVHWSGGSYDGCSQKEEERSATTGVGPHETL